MTTYVEDSEGKYIPASQRPDGTWRKARRVKEGYVPQEEVPLYESKGKQHMKKPDIPVGMCPIIAQQTKLKRDKQKQQSNKIPGIIQLPSASNINVPASTKKETKVLNQSTNNSSTTKKPSKSKSNDTKASNNTSTTAVCDAVSNLSLSSDQDVVKQLKKLRKKVREIEAIEEKLASGQLKNPEQDQLDKVARKKQILKELYEFEKLETPP